MYSNTGDGFRFYAVNFVKEKSISHQFVNRVMAKMKFHSFHHTSNVLWMMAIKEPGLCPVVTGGRN